MSKTENNSVPVSDEKLSIRKSMEPSKDRVAKWRAKFTQDEQKKAKNKHAQLMKNRRATESCAEKLERRKRDKESKAQKRAAMSEGEKSKQRELEKKRKEQKRAAMTEDEKSKQREKDRLRKASKKDPAPDNWRTLPREWTKPSTAIYKANEHEMNRLYKETRRKENSEAEAEFERIQNLLIKRKTRAKRSDEERKEQNAKAKNGMQFLPMIPFKSRRKSKGQRKEYMWWQFWKKGDENKELLRTKLPKFGTKFDQWDSKSENPYKMDEEKEEKWNGMSHCEKMHEKNKLRRKLIKEQLQQPIDMPELELSEYEKIREKNIAEQEAKFQKHMMELDNNNSKN